MNYYISDLHLTCSSMLEGSSVGYSDKRPFGSVEEMQDYIMKKWNSKVTNADHVYILGDIDKKGYNKDVVSFIANLKGNKHLIVGNHDDVRDLRLKNLFVDVCDYKEITDNSGNESYKLVLSHYPILMWNGQHRGWIHLYGHVHETYDELFFKNAVKELNKYYERRDGDKYIPFQAYNVCCTIQGYEPKSLKEILKL